MGFKISNEKKEVIKKIIFINNRLSFQVNNLITLFCILNKDIIFVILPIIRRNLIFNFFIMFLIIIISKEEYINEVTIKIKGKGQQKILSDSNICRDYRNSFNSFPDKITINGREVTSKKKYSYEMTEDINNVTMKWNNPLTNCNLMFKDLINIIYFDFSKFDTSKVSNMRCMFYNCSNITSINVSNFITSNVKDMGSMLSDCNKIKSLDLYNFDTSLVTNMYHMFYQVYNMTYLNIKSFKTSKVINMTGMFEACFSLKSLDITNFDTSSVELMWAMFHLCKSLTSLDLSSFNTSKVTDMRMLFKECFSLKLLNIDNFDTSKVKEFTEAFDSCEISNILYCSNKNNKLTSLLSKNNNCTHFCYLDPNHKIIEKTKECIDSCTNSNDYKYEYNNSCYNACPNNTKAYSNNKFLCYKECSQNSKYINTNNDCVEECTSNDFFTGKCKLKNNNSDDKDDLINQISKDITGKSLEKLITNVLEGDKKDLIVEDDNMVYQITSTCNQNNNANSNISKILLGECENTLRSAYNISSNLSLLIFKIDYYQQYYSNPIIGYEIYHPISKIKLNISLCNSSNISFNIPVSIDENNLYKYDPNNEYYNDQCNPTSKESRTDILLSDRQNEFNTNNLSLCENNCTYNGYNTNKTVNCECGIKYNQIVISELTGLKYVQIYNFTNKKNDMITMKCISTLFTKEGIVGNIGNYILAFIIIIFSIATILFYKCGYHLLENDIQEILASKEKKEIKNQKNKLVHETGGHKDKNKDKKKIKRKTHKKSKTNKNAPAKKKKTQSRDFRIKKNNSNDLDSISQSKAELHKKVHINLNSKTNDISNNKLAINISKNHTDYELNHFPYHDSLLYDKRKFNAYYISLIKAKHPLIFSFWPRNDYNSMIIKVCLFFLSFSFYYFVNSLFFDEKTIHKIYEDKGIYNFIYLAPYILFSFLISHTLSIIIKYIFLSERNLYEIKNQKTYRKAKDKVSNVRRCLIIKYICFFVVSYIFLSFFWYYLSSFGAVYQNTQIFIIENTLISFSISLLYPFVINAIPSLLRIYSLKESNRELCYKISQYIQYI